MTLPSRRTTDRPDPWRSSSGPLIPGTWGGCMAWTALCRASSREMQKTHLPKQSCFRLEFPLPPRLFEPSCDSSTRGAASNKHLELVRRRQQRPEMKPDLSLRPSLSFTLELGLTGALKCLRGRSTGPDRFVRLLTQVFGQGQAGPFRYEMPQATGSGRRSPSLPSKTKEDN